jgi:hypothetical protein
MKGVEAVQGVKAQDMGILTTPQLHWMVRAVNSGLPSLESDYFATLSQAFRFVFLMVPTAVILVMMLYLQVLEHLVCELCPSFSLVVEWSVSMLFS